MRLADSPVIVHSVAFWRWWTAELRGMMPAGFRAFLGGWRRLLVVSITPDRLALSLSRGGERREIGAVTLAQSDPAGAAAILRDVLRSNAGAYDLVALRLPPERALRRRTRLPLAVRDNLEEAVGYDMDRQTPFSEDEVYFAARESAVDRAAGWVDVDLEIVRCEDVDPAIATLDAAGLPVDRLEIGEGGGGNLLPRAQRSERGTLLRRATAALCIVAIVLAAAAAYLPLHQLRGELANVEAQLESARRAAIQVDDMRSQLASMTEREARIFERKQNEPMALSVLAALTEGLPADSFAFEFAYDGEEIVITGYSRRAANLIARLENVSAFEDVRFRSPVTRDRRIGHDRYNLSARISAEGGAR